MEPDMDCDFKESEKLMHHSEDCASNPPNFWLCDCGLEDESKTVTHGQLDELPFNEELERVLASEGFNSDDRYWIINAVEWVVERRLMGKDSRWASMERDRRKNELVDYINHLDEDYLP